jgi:GNAT superfamily N-acetyltransferase
MRENEVKVIAVTDEQGKVIAENWLHRAEPVHRQLRPKLDDYAARMREVFATGGRMRVCAIGDKAAGVAIYRIYESTYDGRRFYVDDLVTDEQQRSTGVGHALLADLQAVARTAGCDSFTLDSGTQRTRAHRFYFREDMVITSFVFKKELQ